MRYKVGDKVRNLLIIKDTGEREHGYWVWECLCDCGNTVFVSDAKIRRTTIKHCGCEELLYKEHKYGWKNTGAKTRVGDYKLKSCQLWENIKLRSTAFGKDYMIHRQESYKNCRCCDEWKDLRVFKEWFDNEEAQGRYKDGWELDKESVKQGNNLYSPEFCRFIPKEINCLLTTPSKCRKNNSLPTGVLKSRSGKYAARIVIDKKVIYLGTFDTPEEAFAEYAIKKKQQIMSILEEFREVLPKDVIIGIENWRVLP